MPARKEGNSMKRVFHMQKMLDRLEREGRMNEVEPEDIELMKKLDGKEGTDYNYCSFVYGEPLVWIEKGDENPGAYVALCDCD